MILYLDSSALVKRYIEEAGGETVRAAMDESDTWFIARIGFVETMRAVALGAPEAIGRARAEWPELDVVEIDQPLIERAVDLAVEHRLRSSDAIHLAAALTLPDVTFASWDDRLSAAAAAEGLALLPR